jgi:tetratricopeptide (TPR) repeat protein
LIEVVAALPEAQRARKLALLDRAALHAKAAPDAADRLWRIGDAAERLNELGAVEKAKALFAEGLRLANQMTDNKEYHRAFFAAQLAVVDPPAALAIAKEFQGVQVGGSFRVALGLRMMEQDPAEALWFWKEMHGIRNVGIWAALARLHMGDPARAQRFFDRLQLTRLTSFRAGCYTCLALGLKARDESASRQAMDEVLRAFDGLMQERPEQLNSRLGQVEALLPAIERIDPALVPEVFWRYVASRPPFANPRTVSAYSPSYLIQYLAWYDRDVAAALFEPSRDRLEHTEDRELTSWSSEFEAWASFDPHAAVARLEKLPVGPDTSRNDPRIRVAGLLGLSREQRSRMMWSD